MTTNAKKTLLIGLGVFGTIVAAVLVVFLVRRPVVQPPTSTPTPTPLPTPTTAPVLQVNPATCSLSFTVTASVPPSSSPSSSPSESPSPSPSTTTGANLTCVVKRMYQDDSRNTAGFYFLNNEITDTSTIQSGQAIVYNIVAGNSGGTAASDTTITDPLSTNLTFMDADNGCTYDSASRIVTCTIGALAGGSQASRSIRVKVTAAGTQSVANTATVASTNGQTSSCSVSITATGQVSLPPSSAPSALPTAGVFEVTAGTMGAGVLLLLVGALGLLLL